MPVRLHHIVVDAYDLPGLARFWTQALGWKVLSERENEVVIGTDENAPVGMCFMPVTDPKTVKNACIGGPPRSGRSDSHCSPARYDTLLERANLRRDG
jgi:Glyoxalase-like domain